jgi:hypothetical protein
MPRMKERRTAIRALRGWAISVLQEAGAIRECEEHGWMQDRGDPHARERAFDIARPDPPVGLSPEEGAAEVSDVLDSMAIPGRVSALGHDRHATMNVRYAPIATGLAAERNVAMGHVWTPRMLPFPRSCYAYTVLGMDRPES